MTRTVPSAFAFVAAVAIPGHADAVELRRTEITPPAAPSCILSADLEGDGLPDLLVAGTGSLRIHRGVARARRGLPVESRPAAVLALPHGIESIGSSWVGMGPDGVRGGSDLGGFFTPLPVDLDGDGIAEIVLLDAKRRDRLSVYRWTARERP